MRVCSGAGCLRVVPDKVRFCGECVPTHAHGDSIREHSTADKYTYAELYASKRWRSLAQVVLKRHPFCVRCDQVPSALADHKIPAGVAVLQARASGLWPLDKYAGFFMLANLEGLCRGCHAKKTQEDKAHVGDWPSVIDVHNNAPKRTFSF